MSKQENAKNEVVVIEGTSYQLQNKTLRKEIENYIKAISNLNRDTWKYAQALYNIVSKQLYEEDFKSIDKLAEVLSTTKSNISKNVSAVDYALKHNVDMANVSVAVCYLFSTLGKNENDFNKWAEKNNINLINISKTRLEEALSLYKESLRKVVDNKEETQPQEDYVIITYDKKHYNVPLKVLSRYLVEE